MASPVPDDVRRVYRGAWWALVLRGLMSLAVGVFVFARPLDSIAAFALLVLPVTLAAIMGLIAAFGIVSGVTLIVGAFTLRSLVQA